MNFSLKYLDVLIFTKQLQHYLNFLFLMPESRIISPTFNCIASMLVEMSSNYIGKDLITIGI